MCISILRLLLLSTLLALPGCVSTPFPRPGKLTQARLREWAGAAGTRQLPPCPTTDQRARAGALLALEKQIPMMALEDATVDTALTFLRARARELNNQEPVLFCAMRSDYFLGTASPEKPTGQRVAIPESTMPLRELLDLICKQADLWWTIGPCDGVPWWTDPVAP